MSDNEQYRIYVQGVLVEVSKDVYQAYYSIERHTRTLVEKDTRNGRVLYSDLDTEKMLGEEMIHDLCAKHVEDVAIHNILCQKLFQCFAMLRASEMELIWALYFEGLTEREYAKQIGISQKGVNKRRQKVLKKLRAMMNIK